VSGRGRALDGRLDRSNRSRPGREPGARDREAPVSSVTLATVSSSFPPPPSPPPPPPPPPPIPPPPPSPSHKSSLSFSLSLALSHPFSLSALILVVLRGEHARASTR
ncbi:hypothetical protein ALC60_05052, partial [Trachymyrmex zeteki]